MVRRKPVGPKHGDFAALLRADGDAVGDRVSQNLIKRPRFRGFPGQIAVLGNGSLRSHPVGPEYSCSLRKIEVVKAVDGREFNNVAGFRCSYRTTLRRVSTQGLVCSPQTVVI